MYPNFQEESLRLKNDPIDREITEPSKPSKLLLVVDILFLIFTISFTVRDCIENREWWVILLDVILILVWISLIFMAIQSFKRYNFFQKLYLFVKQHDDLVLANPAVTISRDLANHAREKYKLTKYTAQDEYMSLEQRKPKQFKKLLETLEEDIQTCEECRRILFKDPSVLKAVAKLDKEQDKLEDKLLLKYKEILYDLSPEERLKKEKEFDNLARSREYAREYYGKKKK